MSKLMLILGACVAVAGGGAYALSASAERDGACCAEATVCHATPVAKAPCCDNPCPRCADGCDGCPVCEIDCAACCGSGATATAVAAAPAKAGACCAVGAECCPDGPCCNLAAKK